MMKGIIVFKKVIWDLLCANSDICFCWINGLFFVMKRNNGFSWQKRIFM